jgi:hypothetical protein
MYTFNARKFRDTMPNNLMGKILTGIVIVLMAVLWLVCVLLSIICALIVPVGIICGAYAIMHFGFHWF